MIPTILLKEIRMKRWLGNYMALAGVLLFLLAPAFSQQNTAVRGSLTGVVFDETQAMVHVPSGNFFR